MTVDTPPETRESYSYVPRIIRNNCHLTGVGISSPGQPRRVQRLPFSHRIVPPSFEDLDNQHGFPVMQSPLYRIYPFAFLMLLWWISTLWAMLHFGWNPLTGFMSVLGFVVLPLVVYYYYLQRFTKVMLIWPDGLHMVDDGIYKPVTQYTPGGKIERTLEEYPGFKLIFLKWLNPAWRLLLKFINLGTVIVQIQGEENDYVLKGVAQPDAHSGLIERLQRALEESQFDMADDTAIIRARMESMDDRLDRIELALRVYGPDALGYLKRIADTFNPSGRGGDESGPADPSTKP